MLRFLHRIFRFLLLLCVLWVLGLLVFVMQIPRAVNDDYSKTDAIVVLTGGSLRLGHGMKLLLGGKAEKLFISGVGKGVKLKDIPFITEMDILGPMHHVPHNMIVLGYSAADTRGNAEETAEWMAKEHFKSMRLITSNYHMPRSVLEMRHAMPGVYIIEDAVFPEHFKFEEWWKFRGTALLILSEYHKTIAVLLRHYMGVTLYHSEGLL